MKVEKLCMPMLILLCLGMLSAVPSLCTATETRVGSMGGVGFYMRDNSNVFYFPATVHRYSEQVISELRVKNSDGAYTIGVHLPLGSASTFGLYLNRPLSVNVPAGVVNRVELNRVTDFYWGTDLGNSLSGIRLSVGMDKFSEDTGEDEYKETARYFALSGGVSSDQYDAAFVFDMPHLSQEEGHEEDKWNGFGLGVNGRLFTGQSGDVQYVPMGTFYYQASSREYDSGALGSQKSEWDYKTMNLGLGLGGNYHLNEDNLIVLGIEGLGLSQTTTEAKDGDKTTNRTMTMPGLYVGVESQIKPWCIGRMGAAQVYQSELTKEEPDQGNKTENTTYSSQFKLTFGMGVRFGGFALDLSLNEGLLFDGPNFVSGSNEVLANRISLTYEFGK